MQKLDIKCGKSEIRCSTCQNFFPFDRFAPTNFCSPGCASISEKHRHINELARHVAAQSQKTKLPWQTNHRVVAIGDVHFPYVSERALFELFKFMRFFKPTRIVQLGDLYDFFSHGRFPRPLSVTPRMEVTEGRKMAVNFWKQIKYEFAEAELFQILGNHDDRPYKQMITKLPEMEPFFDIAGMWQFDGVKTTYDSKQELVLDGTCFMHGHKKFGAHVAYNLMPTVCGHSHTGGVHFLNVRDQIIFELNAGYIADPTQGPLQYREQRWSKWTHGVGAIDELGPRFCPL